MTQHFEGPDIYEARVWQSDGFVETINRSQLGYSDGTGSQSDISETLRPSAFGLATFDFTLALRFLVLSFGPPFLGRGIIPRPRRMSPNPKVAFVYICNKSLFQDGNCCLLMVAFVDARLSFPIDCFSLRHCLAGCALGTRRLVLDGGVKMVDS